MIKFFIPWVGKTEKVVVTGESDRLGNWNPPNGIPLKRLNAFFYTSDLKIEKDEQWKLVIVEDSSITWEEGENRIGAPEGVVRFRGGRKATGIEIPIFSLRSQSDNGIGDFGSLLQFIDIAKNEGYKAVQILPIGDTGCVTDPYESISAFAINPIYLCLDKMGNLDDIDTAHAVADKSEELSYSQIVEWEEVREIKWQYFRAIYRQDGDATCQGKDFRQFTEREKEWLLPYCVFCYLREHEKTDQYSPALVEELTKNESAGKEILFYAFLQYHADRQLQEVHSEYLKAGILLAGEIPYSVSRESADIWQNPDLFYKEYNVGTMPDAENETGQKWNRVPFNWKGKNLDRWWRIRLKKMSRYFDLCRLENSAGYFRQWMVPQNYGTALRGQINPCKPYLIKELKEAGYGTGKSKDLEPLITKEYLQTLFGPQFNRFGEFFKRHLDGRYYFKPDMGSVSAIYRYFENRKEEEQYICQGLVRILDECLFVRTAGGYQPRIAAQFTNAYTALDPKQKEVFNRIYDDFYYSPQNRELWIKNGEKHLKALSGYSSMPLYADCTAPAEIDSVMFLALERRGYTAGQTDINMPYSHDMPPFTQWWSELPGEKKQKYWSGVMGWKDCASSKPIRAIYSDIVKRMRHSASPLVILPYQDLCKKSVDYNGVPIPSRIATPGKKDSSWVWRVPETIGK